MGLKQVEPNTELNILFKFEDHCFHYTLHEAELITWSYLENNSWVNFNKKNILLDTTNNFITSGILKIRTPSTVCMDNTIMTPDLFWIRATSGNKTGVKPRIIGIAINGVTAIRKNSLNLNTEETISIAPGIIKVFEKTLKGVNAVWQLFPSLYGKAPESTEKYYVRISERLRHKNRPTQIRDIEQVVLEEFPEIMMVKCFNANSEENVFIHGVNLHLVLIPKELKAGHYLKEEPQVSLSTLLNVKVFLKKLISPFVNIEVGNPVFEKIKIICKIILTDKAAEDSAYYLRHLITEINNYIAPWLFGKYDDFKIGNRIYKSDILMFIKTRPYIKYVTGFSAIHFFNHKDDLTNELIYERTDTAQNDTNFITSSSPASVLIPSANHIITFLKEPIYAPAKTSGIGDFIVGDELLIADDLNKKPTSDYSESINDLEDDERFSLIITHYI